VRTKAQCHEFPANEETGDFAPLADLFEYLHHIRTAEGEPRFDRGREAREVSTIVSTRSLRPGRKLIMDEVHRPISFGRVADILAQLTRRLPSEFAA
jgi:hypothetical protein